MILESFLVTIYHYEFSPQPLIDFKLVLALCIHSRIASPPLELNRTTFLGSVVSLQHQLTVEALKLLVFSNKIILLLLFYRMELCFFYFTESEFARCAVSDWNLVILHSEFSSQAPSDVGCGEVAISRVFN